VTTENKRALTNFRQETEVAFESQAVIKQAERNWLRCLFGGIIGRRFVMRRNRKSCIYTLRIAKGAPSTTTKKW
jgi:hypothetical protein